LSFLKKIYASLKKNLKFSISDPENFEEVWSFNSNRIRVGSLGLIILLICSIGFAYLINSGSMSGYFGKDDVSIERQELEEQTQQISALTEKISAQESYIENIKLILSGEIPIDSPLDTIIKDMKDIDFDKLNASETDSEKELAKKIKDDMRTASSQNKSITYFASPVVGVISQEYNKKNHPGIDVVTEKDKAVKACSPGTVIYSGYTRKDGHIIIIDHANKFISVYKHNKRTLKKIGTKVRMGDPISIVGNTGENTDGPHLHFELWFDQSPVNPKDYMKFTR
jgi:murein DD-endopeptidase MepM/ murein hydrolase activator NlpD